MDPLRRRRLEKTINSLSVIIEVTDTQKETLLSNYSKMQDTEIIKDLAIKVYRNIGPSSPHYDYALNIIKNYNFSLCPSIEEMKSILADMFSNTIAGNMSLEDNHQLVQKALTIFCNLFNQYEVDYYVVGALPCFLKTNQSLFRYHDDIDILINEKDIYKLSSIFENSNYTLIDDRFPTTERFKERQKTKPPHIVMAQNQENEFHIGFFCFRRENNTSITTREYYHHLENNQVITDVKERTSTPLGTSLRYDEEPLMFNGTQFRTSSIENVYNLKSYTQRPKDITDNERLDLYIDREKLQKIMENKNQEVIIKNVKNTSDEI